MGIPRLVAGAAYLAFLTRFDRAIHEWRVLFRWLRCNELKVWYTKRQPLEFMLSSMKMQGAFWQFEL